MHDTDDRTGTLVLEPNLVLPEQFFDRSRSATGPRRLLSAILEDALRVYARCMLPHHTARDRRAIREAAHWLDTNDLDFPFSFLNVCAVLGLDARAIRDAIRRATGRPGSLMHALPRPTHVVPSHRRTLRAVRDRRLAVAR
jgi:hypothetical protein